MVDLDEDKEVAENSDYIGCETGNGRFVVMMIMLMSKRADIFWVCDVDDGNCDGDKATDDHDYFDAEDNDDDDDDDEQNDGPPLLGL